MKKVSTTLMRNAMIHIDEAIIDLSMTQNYGIELGATNKLKQIYDWLGATAKVLDDMEEIERIGDEQRG